jgi:hypothetical protein
MEENLSILRNNIKVAADKLNEATELLLVRTAGKYDDELYKRMVELQYEWRQAVDAYNEAGKKEGDNI